MDISSHLLTIPRNDFNPPNPTVDLVGWDKTHSHEVSQNAAFQIKEVVTFQTRKVAESPGFDLVTKQAEKSSHQVQFLQHSDIELGSLIGNGTFNQVFELQSLKREEAKESFLDHQSRPNRYVVKVLRPELANDSWMFALCACDIVNEALLMAALDHPHILKVRAVSQGGIAAFEHGRSPDAFFMVMTKLEESLEDRLETSWKGRLRNLRCSRPRDRATFFRQRYQILVTLANALAYLHSLRIIHRDVKPQNIGFDSQGTLKLFDFGSARLIPQSNDPDETFRLSRQAGTLRYISPENYRGQPYNLKADVYSFTILMHEVLSLQTPDICFMEKKKDEPLIWRPYLRPTIPLLWPKSIRRLLRQGWAEESSKRPTMQQMHDQLKHKDLD